MSDGIKQWGVVLFSILFVYGFVMPSCGARNVNEGLKMSEIAPLWDPEQISSEVAFNPEDGNNFDLASYSDEYSGQSFENDEETTTEEMVLPTESPMEPENMRERIGVYLQ